MRIFKRKQRYWGSNKVTEQKYIDYHLKQIKFELEVLVEELDILKGINKVDYIVLEKNGTRIKGNWYETDSARKWVKENNYQFERIVKTGELWIRKEK